MKLLLAAGYIGAFLTVVAYVPQIVHLIRAKCSAGVSIVTYSIWIGASIFMFIHALSISSIIFSIQQIINFFAICTIIFFAVKYRGHVCSAHKYG